MLFSRLLVLTGLICVTGCSEDGGSPLAPSDAADTTPSDLGVETSVDSTIDASDATPDTAMAADADAVTEAEADAVSEGDADATEDAGDADAAPLSTELWVVRVGDGMTAVTTAAAPVTIERLQLPAGTVVGTIALPIAASGAEKPFTLAQRSGEGFLMRSGNGRFVTMIGYGAAPGTADVSGSLTSAVPRVIARLDGAGATSTSTTTTTYDESSVRSVVTNDGNQFWLTTTNMLGYLGSFGTDVTATTIASGANFRALSILYGALYGVRGTGPEILFNFATPFPTTTSPVVSLPGGPTSGGPWSMIGFARGTEMDLVYVCQEVAASSGGGLQRWTKAGGTWSLAATLAPATTTGCRALSGTFSAGRATLYAVTALPLPELVTMVDDPSSSTLPTPTVLMTATSSKLIRGIALRPDP